MEVQRIVRSTAGATKESKPEGAVASVFDIVKKRFRGRAVPFDPHKVEVTYDVPVPAKRNGGTDRCKILLDSMKPGGSILLSNMQAKSVKAASRRLGVEVTVRKDEKDPTMTRVWRVK